jgi:hypothetical protein
MTEADIATLKEELTSDSGFNTCVVLLVEDDKAREVLRNMVATADRIAASKVREG